MSTPRFQFSVECERVVSPYIHRTRELQAGRTDAARCRKGFTRVPTLVKVYTPIQGPINDVWQPVWDTYTLSSPFYSRNVKKFTGIVIKSSLHLEHAEVKTNRSRFHFSLSLGLRALLFAFNIHFLAALCRHTRIFAVPSDCKNLMLFPTKLSQV
ncbi:hypothetical protein J6590_025646 [Homalodisca vitripennis]|nr:hypothetical protein J6590_025646 [Homalodisca vitripennis]